MDSIVIKVSDLLRLANELAKNQMKYVELFIDEADGDGADALPACVNFTAYDGDASKMGVDYEEIEAVSADEFTPWLE